MSDKTNPESEINRPSFIKIAPGAKVDGLDMTGNRFFGDADVINNQGELKNLSLDRNIHFVPPKTESKKSWWKKPEVVIPILIGLISIPWWPQIYELIRSLLGFES